VTKSEHFALSFWQQHCVKMKLPGWHRLWFWMFTKDYGGLRWNTQNCVCH